MAEMAAIDGSGLRRVLQHIEGPPGPVVVVGDRSYILLGSNNYLDLARHPRVLAGARAALERYGAGAGASRLVSGGTTLHRELEVRLAAWLGAEDSLLFSSGYLANVSTIAALVGRGDTVFSDALNHASIIDGCRLSGAAVEVYPHADLAALEQQLKRARSGRRLLVSDTIFSMEGDTAPLRRLAAMADDHGAMLMLDESHAVGVLGLTGAGAAELHGVASVADLRMGTLSKALGSAGGFIAASALLIDYLRHRARGFVFDTAPAPAAVGAALAAVEVVLAEPDRRARLHRQTGRLRAALEAGGLSPLPGESAILPVLVGDPRRAMAISAAARAGGVIAPAIRPPSVPEGGSRLRLTVSPGFDDSLIDRAAEVVLAAAAEAGP
jgi:8-amino-7-oxononanoate synthase